MADVATTTMVVATTTMVVAVVALVVQGMSQLVVFARCNSNSRSSRSRRMMVVPQALSPRRKAAHVIAVVELVIGGTNAPIKI